MKLKLKVFLTNVSRIIRSFIFVNMTWLLNTKAKAAEIMCYDTVQVEPPVKNSIVNETVTNEVVNSAAITNNVTNKVIDTIMCYSISPEELDRQHGIKSLPEKIIDAIVEDPEKVFFLLVPFILLAIVFAVIMHKISERKKAKKEEMNTKENNIKNVEENSPNSEKDENK